MAHYSRNGPLFGTPYMVSLAAPRNSEMALYFRYGPLNQLWPIIPETSNPFDIIYAATIGALLRPLLDPGSHTEGAHLAADGSQVTPYMLRLVGDLMRGPTGVQCCPE